MDTIYNFRDPKAKVDKIIILSIHANKWVVFCIASVKVGPTKAIYIPYNAFLKTSKSSIQKVFSLVELELREKLGGILKESAFISYLKIYNKPKETIKNNTKRNNLPYPFNLSFMDKNKYISSAEIPIIYWGLKNIHK